MQKDMDFCLLLTKWAISIAKNLFVVLKNLQHTIETASKREIHEIAEATGDLIGNKIADKITSISNKSSTELHSKKLDLQNEDETDIPKDLQKKRQQIIDELRLVQ